MIQYKNDNDSMYVFAAKLNILFLEECIAWCDYVLKKCEEDQSYKDLMYFVSSPDYEKALAEKYKKEMEHAIVSLDNPDESTPEGRKINRALIAQVRTWGMDWDKGKVFRAHIYKGGEIPPGLYDVYTVTYPSVISGIVVPADVRPGYDPFCDNQ